MVSPSGLSWAVLGPSWAILGVIVPSWGLLGRLLGGNGSGLAEIKNTLPDGTIRHPNTPQTRESTVPDFCKVGRPAHPDVPNDKDMRKVWNKMEAKDRAPWAVWCHDHNEAVGEGLPPPEPTFEAGAWRTTSV